MNPFTTEKKEMSLTWARRIEKLKMYNMLSSRIPKLLILSFLLLHWCGILQFLISWCGAWPISPHL